MINGRATHDVSAFAFSTGLIQIGNMLFEVQAETWQSDDTTAHNRIDDEITDETAEKWERKR